MAFDGNGVYTPPSPEFPAITQTIISSSDFNTIIADIASALGLTLCRDGQSTPTANLPMGGFKLTGLGAGAVAGDSVEYAQFAAAFVNTLITTTLAGGGFRVTGDLADFSALTELRLPANSKIGLSQLATQAFVLATAFSTALPSQAGNAGKFVTTDGVNASWVIIPLDRTSQLQGVI